MLISPSVLFYLLSNIPFRIYVYEAPHFATSSTFPIGPRTPLSTIFIHTLSPYNQTKQTADRIKILYVLIFVFLIRRLKGKIF
jgi:hypothetical protein